MDRSARVVFLGCPPCAATSRALAQWQARLQADLTPGPAPGAVRWLARPALHLTLHYLGRLAPPQIQSVQARMGEVLVRAGTIPVTLGDPKVFPRSAQARGICVEVLDVADRLRPLHAAMHERLSRLGLESRSVPLRSHFTLGRWPRSVKRGQRRAIVQTVQTAPSRQPGISGSGELDRVHLYATLPRPGGNVYQPLATWLLTRPPT